MGIRRQHWVVCGVADLLCGYRVWTTRCKIAGRSGADDIAALLRLWTVWQWHGTDGDKTAAGLLRALIRRVTR